HRVVEGRPEKDRAFLKGAMWLRKLYTETAVESAGRERHAAPREWCTGGSGQVHSRCCQALRLGAAARARQPGCYFLTVLRSMSQGKSCDFGSLRPPSLGSLTTVLSVHFRISAWPSAKERPPARLW